MKLLRPILYSLSVLLLLGLIVVGLALTPSVQRWAILRAAAKQPDLQLKLDSVSAGLSSLSVRGVELEQRGVKVSFDHLTAEYSLWAFLAGQRVEIRQLTARGLVVDASKVPPQKAQAGLAAAPSATPAALAQVKLPYELVLGSVDIQGRVLIAGASGRPALQSEFSLSGGQIGPDREGALKLTARVSDPNPAAGVATLEATATLQLRETRQLNFDHIVLSTLLEATGPGLVGKNQLKLSAEMSRAIAGEKYRVSVDTVRAGQSENLLALTASLASGAAAYTGDWMLAARSVQLESFLLGRPLPQFAANGSGQFAFSPANSAGTLQGALQVEASAFEKLQPELRAIGPVRLKSDFDIGVEKGVLRLKKMAIALAGEQPVLELHSIGSPAFNLQKRRFETAPATAAGAGEIIRLKIAGLPLAWIAPFCGGVEISGGPLTGEIAVVQGEGNQLSLQTTTPLQSDGLTVIQAGRPLLTKAGVKLDAEAELSPTRAQAKIRSLTLKTAAGDTVNAKLSVTAPFGLRFPLEIAGDFTADLPAFVDTLFPAGPMKGRGFFGCNWQGDRLEVLRFAVEATEPKGQLLASATLTRAFTYDLAKARVETGAPNEVTLGNFKLGQLPLITLPKIAGDTTVSGRLGPAELAITALDGKVTARAIAPVSLQDLSVSKKKKLMWDRLKLKFQPVFEFSNGIVTLVQSGKVSLRTATEIALAELSAELTQGETGLKAVTTFSFDLPAWASQPALVGRDALSAGQASGELRAAMVGGGVQLEARATLNGLVANEGGKTLPVANLSLRADVDANGKFSVKAPVLLDRAGQRSDLNISAEGTTAPTGLSFDAKVVSEHVELQDLLLLLAAAGSPLAGEGEDSVAAQTRALSPPAADHVPFWAGTTGQIALDCKSVVRGQDWSMSGLTGRLVLGAEQVQLEKLEASFDEKSRFAAKGTLTFAEGLDPYHLTGEFALTEFDAGKLFKALDPERTPTLEGMFTVKGQLEGQGLNLADTVDRTRGTFDLTSRKGVFRALKKISDKHSVASMAVGLVTSFMSDDVQNAEKLARELAELKFDLFSVKLMRDASLDLKLEDISLVTPELRLLGSGAVKYAAGLPILQQPLEATLSLSSRGKIEDYLGRLKLLDSTRDEMGYAKAKETLLIGGTIALPNANEFYARLIENKILNRLIPTE